MPCSWNTEARRGGARRGGTSGPLSPHWLGCPATCAGTGSRAHKTEEVGSASGFSLPFAWCPHRS
ncbi:hypothetical protein J1605_004318 [Eschrichtius robustus]|uniref:Uncharacterized protein n=1 Tax=Eschrichtius robustus TaxID=9764 RepID=A0AB34HI19_ESCRO|nr:hypothetical protein J1605_004318 [Eschrichtius robustus]